MVDSITIKIPEIAFKLGVNHLNYFTYKKSSKRGYFAQNKKVSEYQNKMKKYGFYFPIIEIISESIQSKRTDYLKIQCSVPKIIYQTNFFEVSDIYLGIFSTLLAQYLAEIDIIIKPQAIKKAIVVKIEFAKIISLTNQCTVFKTLEILQKINYKTKSNFQKINYQNGESIKYYNKSQSITFYDKLKEIENEGFTKTEKAIIRQYGCEEILKIEVSLQNKQAINREVSEYFKINNFPSKKEYTLKDVFKAELSKYIINKKLNGLLDEKVIKLIDLSLRNDTKLRDYLSKYYKIEKIAILYYFISSIKQYGLSGTIKLLKKQLGKQKFYRYKKDIGNTIIQYPVSKTKRMQIIKYLKKEVKVFKLSLPLSVPIV